MTTEKHPSHIARLTIATTILLLALALNSHAQSWTQYDQGTPPQHAAGVSPLGSYLSTELGTVSLSNGSLNLSLPLTSVGGRGFNVPIALHYNSKVWSVAKDYDQNLNGEGQEVLMAYANFGESSAFAGYFGSAGGGWTIGGVPRMKKQFVGINPCDPNHSTFYSYGLTKLTALMPDGSELEFRDDTSDGATRSLAYGCSPVDVSRGERWHATDGSGAIFISANTNGVVAGDLGGTLITADGMRYHFPTTSGGTDFTVTVGADRITDRNGNYVTIGQTSNPAAETFTDQLGRTVTIKPQTADPDNGSLTLAALITVQGYGSTTRYYKVRSGTIGTHLRSDINASYDGGPIVTGYDNNIGRCYGGYGGSHPSWNYLFPNSYCGFQEEIDGIPEVTELDLPDGQALHFNYDMYGEVAEVVLPTGAKIQYDYGSVSSLPSGITLSYETSAQGNSVGGIDRAVTQRRTYPNGTDLEATWNYDYAPANCSSSPCMDVKAYAGDPTNGTILLNQRHYFLPASRYLSPNEYSVTGTGYSLWSTGLEKRTEIRDASNNVISAVEQDWSQRAAPYYVGGEQISNDNRVNETRHYLDNGSFAKTDTFYDDANYPRANNVSEVWEYDFDGTLKRRSTTSYVPGSYQTDDSIHLSSLPSVQTVFDGNNNQVAQATYEYDNYAGDGNHLAMCSYDYGTVIGHDASYNCSRTARGNVTATGHWLNTNNSFIYSYLSYDILGNAVGSNDANGNLTTINYNDDFGNGSNPGGGAVGAYGATYAFPTLITSPPPQTGQPQQTARSQYDFSTGLLTGFKNRNGIVTQTFYNDPFDRPTLVKSALGISGVESHAVMYYAPTTVFGITLTNNDVLTAKDQTSLDDAVLRGWAHTDGFGRTVQSWSRDPQGDDEVITIYDALNRVKQVSNPFRPSVPGSSASYTTTVYDLAGRVTSVTTPDSAIVSTSYSANTVTVTDQTNKQRKSVTDGLGRLKEVYEAPNGSNYLTSYAYDALDNLTGVSQVDPVSGYNQTRTFAYDSLKRLLSATNPESGTVCYGTVVGGVCQADGYDGNGNLRFKTDARLIRTTYGYDALNRAISRGYSDGSTPAVTYGYDAAGVPNSTGRLTSVSSSVSTYNYTEYDAAGRVKAANQVIGAQTYTMHYTYDLAGHVRSMSYPSNDFVNYNYDTAGRLGDRDATNLAFTGNLGDGGQTKNYSTGISYSPFGGMSQEQFGTTTPIFNKLLYNSRGQLSEILASTAGNDASFDRGKIVNDYSLQCSGAGCNGSDNNGNLMKQEHWIPNSSGQVAAIFTQKYRYDDLNRLQRVFDGDPNNTTWQQYYNYDRYGNRTINTGATHDVGVTTYSFGVDVTTNRLTPATGTMHYDAAGNLDNDTYTGGGTRVYDAENRMTQADNGADTYSYDGDGRRVKRIVGGAETRQVYGAGGELLAEYSSTGVLQKEYGYRNGQLLVTADAPVTGGGGSWGPPPGFNGPDPLLAGYDIKLENLTDLRSAVNQLRSHAGLGAFNFTVDPNPQQYVTSVKADHIRQLRTALEQARTALGLPNGGYAHATLTESQSSIYAIDFQELRQQIRSAWNNGNVKLPLISATASSNHSAPYDASHAIDNNYEDLWSAGAFPSQWIQVDLGQAKTISQVRLLVDQSPNGHTTHQVYGGPSPNNLTLLGTFDGDTVFHQWLELSTNASNIRYIKVSTTQSPSWVGWAEIEVYGPAGNTPAQLHWMVADQLGTPRMVFDQSGSLANVSRHDYLPFGEELTTQGGRTPQLGYVGDSTRQKFTRKERDIETGLDYFLARYYSSAQARFTSPDEFSGGPDELFVFTGDSKRQAIPYAEITQPQSLNKYTYVYNSPCRYTDSDGHCGAPSGLQPGQVGICVASYIQSKLVWGGAPTPGRGDGRGTNGQGGTSRVEVRVVVDAKGNVIKTDETMGRSGIFIKDLGPKGKGGSEVSSPNRDEKGNVYFQIHQLGTSSTPVAAIGSIENHLNMVVTTDQKVGITPSSTAKEYPSLEVYKYTMDDKGKITTTLIKSQTESGNVFDLMHKEKPIKADAQ